MITPLFATSVTKNSVTVKIECVIIVICLVRFWALLMKSAKYKVPKFFTVVFHNLSGYDSHLFIKILGYSKGDISSIPNNEVNYISFPKHVIVDKCVNEEGKEIHAKNELSSIDSLRFMASSLDKLSSNLKINKTVNLKKYYSIISSVFCWERMYIHMIFMMNGWKN